MIQLPLRVGIIGAGPAGLTAAYTLSKQGVDVDVFEADPEYVGGISRTVRYKGFRFDIGGHRFFSKSQEIEDLWSEILPSGMVVKSRLSRIYYRGKFYAYPMEAGEIINNLGKTESLLCIGSYLRAKLRPHRNPLNLEDWLTAKFGRRLYRTFFKTYTEKVWGRPCGEIASDWAAQRIKGLSLSSAAIASLRLRPRLGSRPSQSKVIKTLIKTFRYPRLGPGMMWEAATDLIRARGGRVVLGARVKAMDYNAESGHWYLQVKQRSADESADGSDGNAQHGPYHQIISTAPLSEVVKAMKVPLPAEARAAAASLGYRDFILVALILRPSVTFPDHWLYIHDPALKVGRIQNFQNWSDDMVDNSGNVCYGMEYFCFKDDALWGQSDVDLIAMAERELIALGLSSAGDVVDGCVVRQPRAYPVYDDTYQKNVGVIRQALSDHCPGLHQVGRNGMHKYNNQDHSMMTAMLAARGILCPNSNLDPWRVNQDAEYIETVELDRRDDVN